MTRTPSHATILLLAILGLAYNGVEANYSTRKMAMQMKKQKKPFPGYNNDNKKQPEADFSWMTGTWYSCQSSLVRTENGQVSISLKEKCGGEAVADVSSVDDKDDENQHLGMAFKWTEPCAIHGLDENSCPGQQEPIPDSCELIRAGRPLTTMNGIFFGVASLDPTKGSDEMALYADHSLYLAYDDASGECSYLSTQASDVEDLDQASCRRAHDNQDTVMYCDFHIQETRFVNGNIAFTSSINNAQLLVKDMADCPVCEKSY